MWHFSNIFFVLQNGDQEANKLFFSLLEKEKLNVPLSSTFPPPPLPSQPTESGKERKPTRIWGSGGGGGGGGDGGSDLAMAVERERKKNEEKEEENFLFEKVAAMTGCRIAALIQYMGESSTMVGWEGGGEEGLGITGSRKRILFAKEKTSIKK